MSALTILGLVGFAPAAFVLYMILGEFEHYFKHNKAFFMVIVGLGIGMVVGFFSLYFPLYVFIWTLGIVALIEIVKFLIMLQKPFRLNHDTTFYGLGLGAGIAAMMVFIYSYSSNLVQVAPRTVLFVFLLSYNYTFIHSSTGALIGYGSYKGDFWKYLGRAFILSGAHGFIMSLVWSASVDMTGKFALLIIGATFATVLIFYIYKEILPETIPEEMKKARGKQQKK